MTNLHGTFNTSSRIIALKDPYYSRNDLLTSSLPVFLTEVSTVSLSQGISVLRSINSQEIPSCRILDSDYSHNNDETSDLLIQSEYLNL